MTDRTSHFIAIGLSKTLKRKPIRLLVEGQPIILFRTSDGEARALQDRCPHRHAPLSDGRVVGDAIECPYHGWRFNGAGALVDMPCHVGALPRMAVPALSVREEAGLLFLGRSGAQTPYLTCASGPDMIAMTMENRVRSTVLDVAENILDATHTHFTHKGILRGLSTRRYRVKITVTAGEDWVEAVYEGEPRQEGLVSRLLEGERGKGVARFRAPGIAELEFWGKRRLNLATTFHLRQEDADTVHGVAILAGPRQGGLGWLKALMLRPFFRIALWQDQQVLEGAKKNAALFGNPQAAIGPLDILRAPISAILDGRAPEMAGKTITFEMDL